MADGVLLEQLVEWQKLQLYFESIANGNYFAGRKNMIESIF